MDSNLVRRPQLTYSCQGMTNVNPAAHRAFLTVFLIVVSSISGLGASGNACARTAHMRIYSATRVSKETGDLDGYELAFEEHKDSTVEALLFVYEGAANDEGIPISGRVSGKNLTMEGTWNEHQIEYPSKKEIVVTHFVRIEGTLDPAWFRGTLKIEGLDTPANVRLKRIDRIWTCKP
jgi:hypothetical protein